MTARFRYLWTTPSVLLSLASLLLHGLANSNYGIFRDELYFIVCGNRPDWGYVDQPALVPVFASGSYALFGSTKHYSELFESYEIAGRIDTPYAMPYETNQPIFVLRGLKLPMREFWQK